MKRKYQQPTTLVIGLTTTTMVCASIRGVSGVADLDIDNNGTDEAGITTGNSRRRSLWDDGEEEEF